jgi:hypothetical protein
MLFDTSSPPAPTEFSRLFNLAEAGLWFVIAIVLLLKPIETLRTVFWRCGLALAFAVFGVSDLIESKTGA